MSSASFQSHETSFSPPQPVASFAGSNPVSTTASPTTAEVTAESHSPPSRVLCRCHGTKKGCRAGDQCPYRHVDMPQASSTPQTTPAILPSHEGPPARSEPTVTRDLPHRIRLHVSGHRAVAAKPIPDAQRINPREFQITQVVRRFSPRRRDEANVTLLAFELVPSDPDFPFELKILQCELKVPAEFPNVGKPMLQVKNPEIPRGYQINIERGFDSLASQRPSRTLLALLNELDRHLEQFLTSEKTQTVKLVANADKGEPSKPVVSQSFRPTATTSPPAPVSVPTAPTYTAQQCSDAQLKRDADVRQLEARMNRTPLFSKSADGKSFNVPVQIPKPARLPVSLRNLKELTLTVPSSYNLEPCTIRLKDVPNEDAQHVENAFEKHAREESASTLMAHINYLTQHMHVMATRTANLPASLPSQFEQTTLSGTDRGVVGNPPDEVEEHVFDEDRPHIKVIPRPPEWDAPADGVEDSSSDLESSDEGYTDSEDDNADAEGGAVLPASASAATATGNSVVISFPNIELYGIELLELAWLAITLKCDRCKSTVDIKNLRPSPSDSSTAVTLTESCTKCSSTLAASFHAESIHANSIKAGHLDLTACTISDILPSMFTPTCSECSTAYPTPPGVMSVRGETTLSVCRACHRKMTFKIPEVKFLRVAAHASNIPLPPRKRKQKENLGIVSGTPLPEFGKCNHYRRSHRWFRFSCCNKIYACDKCHDDQAEPKHPNEHANRMICGYCSREQNYRPEDCGVCGRSLVGRRGGGFWEGGKGTRDKLKMSRKDPRKYKRRGGTAPRGA